MTINEKLQKAMKAMTVANLGDSKLSPEKASQFIRVLQDASPILKAARRIDMKSHTRDIDRIGFSASVELQGATEGVALSEAAVANTYTNQLIAQEFGLVKGLTDSAIEDSIDNLENVIVALMGDKAGKDLEYVGLRGDKSGSGVLAKTDGWLKKAGNVVDGTANADFTATDVISMFDAMIKALPQKYDNRSSLKFYVTRDQENAYRDVLVQRGTSLGDAAITGNAAVSYKGVELVVVPNMPAAQALLVDPNNLVYGIYRDIRIEEDRDPKARKTDFVLTVRADFHFENEEAAVVAKGANI